MPDGLSESPCGVAGEVFGEKVSGSGEFIANQSQPNQPCSHGEFRILVLLGFWACRSQLLCKFRKSQAKLNVTFQLPGVQAVLFTVFRSVELEQSELNRTFGKGRMVV